MPASVRLMFTEHRAWVCSTVLLEAAPTWSCGVLHETTYRKGEHRPKHLHMSGVRSHRSTPLTEGSTVKQTEPVWGFCLCFVFFYITGATGGAGGGGGGGEGNSELLDLRHPLQDGGGDGWDHCSGQQVSSGNWKWTLIESKFLIFKLWIELYINSNKHSYIHMSTRTLVPLTGAEHGQKTQGLSRSENIPLVLKV